MPCYQVKNLQMKGVVLPWGSVCAVFQDSSEFQKSSISTMSDTYVLVRPIVFVKHQTIRKLYETKYKKQFCSLRLYTVDVMTISNILVKCWPWE